MESKNNVAIISVLIAMVALIILILSLSYIIFSQPATKAKVENLINPLADFGQADYDYQNIIHISDNKDSEDEDENDPIISGLPDINLGFGQFTSLDLDNYASDDEDSHSELSFEIIYTPTFTPAPITLNIDNSTHILTITEVNGTWTGTQAVTIRVIDTDDNTDEDSFTVTITDGGSSPNGPNVVGIPDIAFGEDGSDSTIDLDDYVTDSDNTDAEMTWTHSGNTNVFISISSSNVVTFTATPNWDGAEFITFRATDPDGHYDEDVMLVTVTPVDDSSIWLPLSNQNINEDSPDSVIYANIISQVTDVDNPIVINVISIHSHYVLSVVGNDLMLSNLYANWYGSEIVVLECNGETAMFTLTINKLLDDCVTICSYGSCYTFCD